MEPGSNTGSHSDRDRPAPPEQRAGIDRTGTGHGSAPNQAPPGQPDAAEPSAERPVDQEGPVGPDGAERPPTDRTADPATVERAAQGDVGEPDPRVSSVPLDTEDGGQVVIEQQNVGPGQQVGGGEFERPGSASLHKRPEDAAAEQERLEHQAPVHGTGTSTAATPSDADMGSARRTQGRDATVHDERDADRGTARDAGARR
jgi:hypothetical protein